MGRRLLCSQGISHMYTIPEMASSLSHTLVGSSAQPDMTFQLFDITVGNSTLRLCNVYSAPGLINLPALPIPTDSGMIYMGDFNARHPALGDVSPTPNRAGRPLLDYIRRYRLTRWDTGGATHTRGGTIDHIITAGLVASNRIAQAERIAVDAGLSFQRQPTPEHLHHYQLARDDLVALQKCVHTESWQKFTDSINHQTSTGTMWHLIKKVVKKKSVCTLHHSPLEYAQDLITTWSEQSQTRNLPGNVQEALSSHRSSRNLRLMGALLQTDEEDDILFTEDELHRALARVKISAPSEDGLTYQVLRLLLNVPSNPLLQLFNLCLRLGHMPSAWIKSTIIPIPKPGTNKFRPISLTSCFSKVFERILLARLMHRLLDKLSPSLYGFLPQRSTHHCLVELYTRLSPTSVVAFLDLKSAFDIANREIILDQLVDFGVRGNLLKWIRGYLCNRTSRVYFKGSYSSYEPFELGTPQGGVLSPFLFNILMHRLLSLLPIIPGTTITCYADDICIHSTSPHDLQRMLRDFNMAATSFGLLFSPEKSRIFTSRNARALPAFTMGGHDIPHCTQYTYLGAPVRITPATPARQRIHPLVKSLLDRLEPRFAPIKWLANNAVGISIPVAMTLYILLLRSIVDYLSPALYQLPKPALEPLEKFQNRVMRFILGCSLSTRFVNMQLELNLPPLVERIYAIVSYFTVKCLHYPNLAPHFTDVISKSLGPDVPRLPLRAGGHTPIRVVSDILRDLDIDVPAKAEPPDLPPWRVPLPAVTFTPTSKDAYPPLQKQLALETIAGISTSVPMAHHVYVDGSVQADGRAACAIFSPTLEPPVPDDSWIGRRLPTSSSFTYCELNAILDAVTLLIRHRVNGIIVCDSQSALHALSSPRPICSRVVNEILCRLAAANDASLTIPFVWIPSHIGLHGNDTVDRIAKAACIVDGHVRDAEPSLRCHPLSWV
ncbi:uncharacterized protein LOC143019134 [Oratosquilla oratoria]|uniref:uncharacterized protein LOC143019134 n=1 Tax=Oratosquilla oratoria TaxID=337810 RepID=UPI003F765DC4